jgi:alpha(1,3/1,4) fucosyltransferase
MDMEKHGHSPNPACIFAPRKDDHDAKYKSGRAPAFLPRLRRLASPVMNFGFWNFYPAFNQNRMFTQPVETQGHDWAYTSRLLGQTLKSLGHQVATLDMQPLAWFDKVLFIEYPTRLNRYYRALLRAGHTDINLMICEPPIVRPDSYNPEVHKPFRRVLTYKKELCLKDPSKYLFHLLTCMPGPKMEPIPFGQRKLCCLIQSYMVLDKPEGLYAERARAARWFEANAPQDFDLMGTEWDRILVPGSIPFVNFALRAAYRRVWPLTRLKFRRFPSYIGPNVKGKHRTLLDYRFCFCYENSIMPDYISEKLFDCFYAGCVPIYLGAPNITDYMPAGTFIDKRNFTYEELHRYLSNMTEREYNGYLAAAGAYLRSPALRPFTPEWHVEMFIKNFT